MTRRITSLLILLLAAAWLGTACSAPDGVAIATPPSVPTLSGQDVAQGDEVRVAILAIRSAVAAQAQYGPILSYLSEEIGRPFVFVPVGQEDQFTVVEGETVDFTFNNPLAATQIRRLYDTEFLATLSRINTGPQFSALIIARSDSGIETIEDLRDKRVVCVDHETAAAGCIFQMFHVMEAGLDPFVDFVAFEEESSQDNIVLGVLNGTWDAGFIRTGQLERMVAEGKLLNLDEITIVDQADDSFYFPHTTRLYPEWPFAALKDTDPALAQAVKGALLTLTPDHPAMVNVGATDFVADVDYSTLDELIETLKLPSWEAAR
jgi:ABC-type phosphate/phosphonate transport system substrate-binding protein